MYKAENELHIAICQAVALLNMTVNDTEQRQAHNILREALVDYADNPPSRLTDAEKAGLSLFRQLVSESDNSLRTLDVFACNGSDHSEDCKCFWEQCEAWAKS